MKKQFIRHNILPVIAAFIWGMAFVAQSESADLIPPFAMNALRSAIAFIFLTALYVGMRKASSLRGENKPIPWKTAIKGGVLCGICLSAAVNFQQFGIADTSAGKAGFITACYIVFVPIFGIFVGKKCSANVWISVLLAAVGLYFLCVKEGFSVSPSDIYVFACAIMFAIHIIVIDKYSVYVDGVLLSLIQFLVTSVISAVFMLIFENPDIANIKMCMGQILYLGIMSSGIAYTLQIISLKGANPTVVSLLLSFESVFAVLGGVMLLNETMSYKEISGCVLMFGAVILAQIDFDKFKIDKSC